MWGHGEERRGLAKINFLTGKILHDSIKRWQIMLNWQFFQYFLALTTLLLLNINVRDVGQTFREFQLLATPPERSRIHMIMIMTFLVWVRR